MIDSCEDEELEENDESQDSYMDEQDGEGDETQQQSSTPLLSNDSTYQRKKGNLVNYSYTTAGSKSTAISN